MTPEDRGDDGTGYAVRPYEPGDETLVALYNEVWGSDRSTAWFRWKYVENPYVDDVPVFVATRKGEVVGAVGLVPFRMRVRDRTALGLLAGDLVVHPDHRRRGVFTRLYRELLEDQGRSGGVDVAGPGAAYADETGFDEAAFLFAYANPSSYPGMVNFGWSTVGPRVTFRRVNDPEPFLRDRLGDRAGGALGPAARAATRGALALRERGVRSPDGVTVTRYEDVPVGTLADLAAGASPPGVHPVYDEAFYEWRFADPTRVYDGTYVARRDGDPLAAVVTRSTADERIGATELSLAHATPLAGEGRDDGVAAALDGVIADRPDVSVLRAWNPAFPDRILRERGFFADDRPPFSRAFEPDFRLVVASLSGAPFTGAALRESGPALWSLAR